MVRVIDDRDRARGAPGVEASIDAGRAARERAPLEEHGYWRPREGRRDPVELLESQAVTRLPDLGPVRYGRMLSSPLAFYRGAAAVMAADLDGSPASGFTVQACGDAHLANFGIFGTPERALVFDVNDFDETLPGPWEWDVKRLAASLAIASRHDGFDIGQREEIVQACGRSYRMALQQFAAMKTMDVWYARLDAEVMQRWRSSATKKQMKKAQKIAVKARGKDSTRALSKLTTTTDGGELRFLSQPPLLVPLSELFSSHDRDQVIEWHEGLLVEYAASLRPEVRHLLSRYRIADLARKVVGVGSVGTRAFVYLLQGRHPADALVLQAKEATASVLEEFVGPSEFHTHGERVVVGQRSMQATSDILLGWIRARGLDGVERDYYLRQLWDWKGSVEVEGALPSGIKMYGEICGWTLARAHARTGDPVAISSYLGSQDLFDRALSRFAESYADQNQADYQRLAEAADDGRLEAVTGI